MMSYYNYNLCVFVVPTDSANHALQYCCIFI